MNIHRKGYHASNVPIGDMFTLAASFDHLVGEGGALFRDQHQIGAAEAEVVAERDLVMTELIAF